MKQGITAEQVKRGMVFGRDGRAPLTAATRLNSEMWGTVGGGTFKPHRWDLLGCDPALAARSDCELFGIAEGFDAAAHGFARTREGGAVDLQRSVPVGAVIGRGKHRRTRVSGNEPLDDGDHLVGFDADRASPEDVRRLCCGEVDALDCGLVPARCTLAIGDHDHHEDIAAGVKWPAKAAPVFGAFAADVLGLDSERAVAPKAHPCDAPGSVLAIGAHEFATCSVVPCRGDMRIECHVPLVSVAQKDVGRAILGHLTDGLPIALRASGKTTTGVAVEWTHGPHPQCRDVELFQVTLRPSNEQPAPAPAAPKVSPTAARDAALAFCSFIDRLKQMAAIAARDAAVHKAIDSVPGGCDAERWGNVVRVIAADIFESAGHHGACEYATNKIHAAIADCTPSVKMYAALRFVHRYSAAEATREVVRAGGADGCPATARLLAAYEAGL